MITSYYIMHRRGIYKPSRSTDNQCKVKAHSEYHYHLIMVFDGNADILDSNGFIVDHQDVDDLIRRMGLKGSCEEMHLKISERLHEFFSSKNIFLRACKCIISPTLPNGPAYMEYVSYQKGYEDALKCI